VLSTGRWEVSTVVESASTKADSGVKLGDVLSAKEVALQGWKPNEEQRNLALIV
jgi:hypothetical protein